MGVFNIQKTDADLCYTISRMYTILFHYRKPVEEESYERV